MSDINLIKTVLFNSATTQEAITRLSELGFTVRECTFTHNGYHLQADQVNYVDITFWQTGSLRCPLSVCINGNLFDYDDRRSFLAGQSEAVVTQVPASCAAKTDQPPFTCPHCKKSLDDTSGCIHKPSTETVDNSRFDYDQAERDWESHSNSLSEFRPKFAFPKIPLIVEVLRLREILRTERRLKNSRVKGLSS